MNVDHALYRLVEVCIRDRSAAGPKSRLEEIKGLNVMGKPERAVFRGSKAPQAAGAIVKIKWIVRSC